MKKNIYIISVILVAVALTTIFLFAIFRKKTLEEAIVKPDDIEKVNNLLKNYSFEEIIDVKTDWSVNTNPPFSDFGYDNFTKYDSAASFVLLSAADTQPPIHISQKVSNIKANRKLTLFGFLRTEDCDSARFEIELYDKDSLLIKGYSDFARGITDWTEYNAWIKTFLPINVAEEDLYVVVKCVLYGRGRIWIDKVRLYSLPEKATIYDLRNYF